MIIFLTLGTLIGAGSLGVVSGLKVRDEILLERRQAREDSIAALALANSATALADSGLAAEVQDSASTSGDGGEEVTPIVDSGEEDAVSVPAVEEPAGNEVAPLPTTGPASSASEDEARALASETAERLGKIFAQMKPGDAAEVLSYLTDEEIERILLGIREREAAAILSQLEPARAAAVSRRVLGSGRSEA